jgi:NAD(P)H-hydrate epimerase
LDAWAFPTRVVWFAQRDQLQGDAALQYDILLRSGIDQSCWLGADKATSELDVSRLATILDAADWLVDGLLGTGLSRPVSGLLRSVIETMNRSDKPIFALDLPSGLDADTGYPLGAAIRAAATASFVAPKIGFSALGASSYTGKVAIIEIGLPRRLVEQFHRTQECECL